MLLLPWLLGWTFVSAQAVRLQVVDAGTERPVAGAEVSWFEFDESRRFWASRLPVPPQQSDWYEMHRKAGLRTACDDGGSAALATEGRRTSVAAVAPGLFGMATLEGTETAPVRVSLSRDREVVVRVIDESGRAAAGVSVGARIVGPGPMSPSLFPWWSETGPEGTATIEHSQMLGDAKLEFVFGFPCDAPPSASFDPTAPEGPFELVLPPTGSIAVDLRGASATAARLRRPGEFAGNRRPGLVLAKDGRAVFSHVGLGLELDLELTGDPSGAPAVRRILGPTEAGQLVELAAAGDRAAITGRLTTWRGEPVRRASATLEVETGSTSSSRGVPFELGEDGSFRWTLPRTRRTGDATRLLLRNLDGLAASDPDLEEERATIELDALIDGAATVDLGRIRMVPPLWRRVGSLSDDELEGAFWRVTENRRRNFDSRGYEACLGEMARRGGDRWTRFLRSALESCSASTMDSDSPFLFDQDLELWIALRRAERKPDPLRLRAKVDAPVETPFPELPVIAVEVLNVDEGKAAPYLLSEESDIARRERLRVEGVAPHGLVMRRRWPSWSGSVWASRSRLEPGERLEWTCDLAEYLVPDFTSEATLRIQYQDAEDIANESSVEGRVLLESAPFVVRWTPRTLSRAAVEAADVATALESIELSAPPVITDQVYRPGASFTTDEGSGHQRILSSGWHALPGLIDALGATGASYERRAWLLALLYDLTGVLDPRRVPSAIDRWREIPGFAPEGEHRSGGGPSDRVHSGSKRDDSAQRGLVDRWLELRSLLQLQDG